MQINPIPLKGNWFMGWALDYHTISSQYSGGKEFDTVRTEAGELLYNIKYKGDIKLIPQAAMIAAGFVKDRALSLCLDGIIPVPPSNLARYFQPVSEITAYLAKELKLPLFDEALLKIRNTSQIKEIDNKSSRRKELQGAFAIKGRSLKNLTILLFDDLYRSGETLKEITKTLYSEGEVKKVCVLTLTKTRSKR